MATTTNASPPHEGSESLSPSTKDSTSSSTAASPGFRSFWKTDRTLPTVVSPSDETSSGLTASSTPTPKQNGNRLSRLFKSSTSGSEDSGKPSAQKRREQIYEAQKRHRNRKADYVKNLENELARLRNMDSAVRQERSLLTTQNQTLRDLLRSHSIDAQLESRNLETGAADVEMLDHVTVDVRLDPELGHERIFVDWPRSENALGSSSDSPIIRPPVKGDSWAALDFILALEWPCRDHIHHPGINPTAKPHVECKLGDFSGHALTATSAVFESALHTPRVGEEKWALPHAEIDKLVKLSEDLPLDDDEMTPAQAYSAIRQNVASDADLRPTLDALKVPLGCIIECRGYGSVIPSDQFWQHLETVKSNLKS